LNILRVLIESSSYLPAGNQNTLVTWIGNRCSFHQPLIIQASCGVKSGRRPVVADCQQGLFPFVRFRMSVGERQPASTVVISRWAIAPIAWDRAWVVEKIPIINGIGMLVDHHEK